MGSRMARHILDGGFSLTVWNRSPGPAREFEEAGVTVADSPEQAVASADLVITMLATPAAVREVMIDGGVLQAMPEDSIWADSSTVSPAFARQSSEWAQTHGCRYLGIPVAGTREPAAAGTLRVLVGGAKSTLDEVRSVLETYSSAIVHVGPEADRGAALKILVNGMLAQSMLVFSEAIKMGEAMGMDRDFLYDTLPGLPVIAPFVQGKVSMMKSDDFGDASFPLELMHKDLNLIVETAYEKDQPALLAALAREIYGRAKAAGMGREDFAAVHRT